MAPQVLHDDIGCAAAQVSKKATVTPEGVFRGPPPDAKLAVFLQKLDLVARCEPEVLTHGLGDGNLALKETLAAIIGETSQDPVV